MLWQGWATLAVVAAVIGALALTRVGPDLIMLAALTVLLTLGVVTPEQATAGFANEGMLTVAVLFVVAAGIRETGAMTALVQRVLGRPHSVAVAQARMMAPVAALSAFMNNTPLVAVTLPLVMDWAKRIRVPASKLLIPLSFATILGGLCTLLGTSTNLVVNGLLLQQAGQPPMGLFDIAWVGLPCAAAGMLYLVVTARWLLPDRRPPISDQDDPREYTVEMLVDDGSPLAGQTIEAVGLRHLPGLYLAEIVRDGDVLPAVASHEKLRARDRLVFVGIIESVVDLQKIRGLTPATHQVFKLTSARVHRCLIEAVVSNQCPLIGQTIREGEFRKVYDAAVIALARSGQRVRQKIGDIVLQAGDTLLLEAHPWFVQRHRNSRDFFLVSQVEGSTPPRHERAWIAIVILLGMVTLAALGWVSMFNAALLAAGTMVLTRCCSGVDARRSIDLQVLLVIAASFGIGNAVQSSGAAQAIAGAFIGFAGNDPWLALVIIYGMTMAATEAMSNNAAAVLMFPIALATAGQIGVNFMPFAVAIMIAASCGFATPIGYQTNLMVYGPGGYRFTDFMRIGIPLNMLMWVITSALAPVVWPFRL